MIKLKTSQWWESVLRRDSKFDGKLFYGVRSTGIFCRPSCPSRRPNKNQVEFFESIAVAKESGYRACKRCCPEDETNPRLAFVGQIVEYIEMHFDKTHTLESLGQHFGMSPFHLQRVFKAVLGVTPRQYLQACRLEQTKKQLQSGQSVTAALYEAGFGSSSRLYEKSNTSLGMTPATYGRKGLGAEICYGIFQSSLGMTLIAATKCGVCFLGFGHSKNSLVGLLKDEFAKASLQQNEAALKPWFTALKNYLDGITNKLELPLEVNGTAFQFRVWQYLRSITPGQTKSYGEIARALGNEKAARAIARACATNKIAIAIPCHRVVRNDGQLGGYRWGVKKKQQLLNREQLCNTN